MNKNEAYFWKYLVAMVVFAMFAAWYLAVEDPFFLFLSVFGVSLSTFGIGLILSRMGALK